MPSQIEDREGAQRVVLSQDSRLVIRRGMPGGPGLPRLDLHPLLIKQPQPCQHSFASLQVGAFGSYRDVQIMSRVPAARTVGYVLIPVLLGQLAHQVVQTEALLIIVVHHQAAAHQRIQLAALEPCHSLGRFTIERSWENGQVPPLGHQACPRPLQALDTVGQLNRLPRGNQQRRGGIRYEQPHLFTVGGIVGQHQNGLLREHLPVEAFEQARRAGNLGFRSERQDDLRHGLYGRGGRGVEAAHIDLNVSLELAAQLLAGEIGELGLADTASADDHGGTAGFEGRQQDAGFFLAPDEVANRVAQLVGESDRGGVAEQSTLDKFVDVLHDGCK